jgi:hypothetical protein
MFLTKGKGIAKGPQHMLRKEQSNESWKNNCWTYQEVMTTENPPDISPRV